MRLLRTVGNVVLWIVAALGVVSLLIWGATELGLIKPLVVVSGSMEPTIMTGDLVIARPHDTAEVEAGQVASLHSAVTGKTITHRIQSIEQIDDSSWQITMKGDANKVEDAEPYVVGSTIWQPVLTIPGGGRVVVTLTKPAVAIPALVALVALLGLTLISTDEDEVEVRDTEEETEGS